MHIAPTRARAQDHAAHLSALVARGSVLVLSGAGISTDSGIPDYRGPDGRRRHAAPMTYERFVGSAGERRRYWARSHLGWQQVARARPNRSHLAVAELQRAGLVTAVVTQNVDGLHTKAGARDVTDLHGRLDAVVCLRCGERRSRLELALRHDALNPGFAVQSGGEQQRPDGDVVLSDADIGGFKVADCRRCGGVLKPDVVFFGEPVPRDRFQRSLRRLQGSSLLLVLGSSLTVGSGYRFVTAAVRDQVPIAIVNRGATRGDRHASLKLDAGLSHVLGPLAGLASAPLDRRVPG